MIIDLRCMYGAKTEIPRWRARFMIPRLFMDRTTITKMIPTTRTLFIPLWDSELCNPIYVLYTTR